MPAEPLAYADFDLIDRLVALVEAHSDSHRLSVVPTRVPDDRADLHLLPARRDRGEASLYASAFAALEDQTFVASVSESNGRFRLRLTDDYIAGLGDHLESPAGRTGTIDLLRGDPYIVDFCDPNATKAFHLGHLRNLALGNAVAACLRAAGASVRRNSQVGDNGRSMAEAIAGYLSFAEGATPESTGVKGDHLVGEFYARYVQESKGENRIPAGAEATIAREIDRYDDLADDVVARLAAREGETTELWRELRKWVMDGQAATLARLRVDTVNQFESDYEREGNELVERGLAAGIFERLDSGAVAFPTERSEYPYFLITRSDGFPTQNLRTLAAWYAVARDAPDAPDLTAINVSGEEWMGFATYNRDILLGIYPDSIAYPHRVVLHGMVESEEGVIRSSLGTMPLVDDLLDGILASTRLRRLLSRKGHDRVSPDQIAAIVALAFCLDKQTSKLLRISSEQILDDGRNIGWAIAESWIRALDPSNDGPPAPAPDDTVYRYLTIRSQVYSQLLKQAVERLDTYGLVRFIAHLCPWYLTQPDNPRLSRVMRTVLAQGLMALGLVQRDAAPFSL